MDLTNFHFERGQQKNDEMLRKYQLEPLTSDDNQIRIIDKYEQNERQYASQA